MTRGFFSTRGDQVDEPTKTLCRQAPLLLILTGTDKNDPPRARPSVRSLPFAALSSKGGGGIEAGERAASRGTLAANGCPPLSLSFSLSFFFFLLRLSSSSTRLHLLLLLLLPRSHRRRPLFLFLVLVGKKKKKQDPEKAGTCCNAPPPLSSSSEGLRQRNAPESSADRASRLKTTAVTNAAFIVERVDENILPGSFLAISESNSGLRGTKIDDLAKVTLARGVVQALFSPAAGLLGDRLNRVHVIAFASFLWGVMTICMGLSRTLTQMLAFSCVNGLGLALLIPCVQSLLADYYTPANRGRAFGLLYFTSSLGQMAGSQFSISLGRRVVAGEEGWRFVFHLVGAISLAMSAAVLLLARDPRVRDPAAAREGKGVVASLRWAGGRLKEMWRDFTIVMRIPTFVVIFLQGIVG